MYVPNDYDEMLAIAKLAGRTDLNIRYADEAKAEALANSISILKEWWIFQINFQTIPNPMIRQNTLTKYCFSPGILYNGLHQTKLGSTPYLVGAHLRDRLKKIRLVPQVCKHQRKEDRV